MLAYTATGTVNVSLSLVGLDNSGVVNLTGQTTFGCNGNPFINRAGGIINQGSRKVRLRANASLNGRTLVNEGTWTGAGEIEFGWNDLALEVSSGGQLTNNGSWTLVDSSEYSQVIPTRGLTVGGTLAGIASLTLPNDFTLTLDGGIVAQQVTTSGAVVATKDSTIPPQLKLLDFSSLQVNTGVTLTIDGSGSLDQSGDSEVIVANGGVLDRYRSNRCSVKSCLWACAVIANWTFESWRLSSTAPRLKVV